MLLLLSILILFHEPADLPIEPPQIVPDIGFRVLGLNYEISVAFEVVKFVAFVVDRERLEPEAPIEIDDVEIQGEIGLALHS